MVTLDLAYLGEPAQGEALPARIDKIGGAINDSRGVVPVADLGDITAEPTDPAPSIARAELLTGLDSDAVELLLAKPVEPLINVQIRHLGGELAEPGGGRDSGCQATPDRGRHAPRSSSYSAAAAKTANMKRPSLVCVLRRHSSVGGPDRLVPSHSTSSAPQRETRSFSPPMTVQLFLDPVLHQVQASKVEAVHDDLQAAHGLPPVEGESEPMSEPCA